MASYKKLDCLILDFDGVILDSVSVKTEVFHEVFIRYPDVYEKAMAYHRGNIGLSRYAKFEYLFKDLLKISDPAHMIKNLSDKFSEMCLKKICECSFIAGTVEFLEYFTKKIPIFLLSTTPQKELEEIIQMRNLCSFFKKIIGSAQVKSSEIEAIVINENFIRNNVYYIGDSLFDYKAAQEARINFIGLNNNFVTFSPDVLSFRDMKEIKNYINKLVTKC